MSTEMGNPATASPRRSYWKLDLLDPERPFFFAWNLHQLIPPDHPVRLIDELLGSCDWGSWEAGYSANLGQPPLHPRVLAGVLLYGMTQGVRSSRKLEEACRLRADFIWLAKGHRPDHSTFCLFRTHFAGPLKELFRDLNRKALEWGLSSLREVAYDGTRVKAYNSRFRTCTPQHLEAKLREWDQYFDRTMEEFRAQDDSSDPAAPEELTAHLAYLEERRQRLQTLLDQARADEAQRRREGVTTSRQICLSDEDARVMPNKEGGYAPNYTPTAVTEGTGGLIVDGDVLNVVNEGAELPAAIARVEADFGKVDTVLTDSGNASGANQQALAERGIIFLAPATSSQPQPGNPACRADPCQPVPEAEWAQLPRNDQRQLDKSCFVFVPEEDLLRCPMGKALRYEQTKREPHGAPGAVRRIYRCPDCAGCPLYGDCVSRKNHRGRTVTRDQYEEVREATAARMATAEAKARYNERPRIAETTFGILKQVMGFRQFLLRGLDKVRTEWRWAITAFNLKKMTRAVGRMRAECATLAVTEA
jgi:transposase